MSKVHVRLLAALLALALIAAACGGDDSEGGSGDETTTSGAPTEEIDYEALGLWDDGPCDESKPTVKIGLTTVFESAGLSLKDQATALDAAVAAFNSRGGANGSCLEAVTCDDGSLLDKAVECARTLVDGGVVATVNDQVTAGQAEYAEALRTAGVPRVAGNVTDKDWDDPNAFTLDASGTGSTFMMPQGLIDAGAKKIGVVRVNQAEAGILVNLLSELFRDDGATFPSDAPVPGGTTDFSQFILGAQDKGADSIMLALDEQLAVQVVKAGQQLDTPLKIGGTLGTFAHTSVAELGDFAEQMVFVWSFPPATFDLPAYEVLRADLAASGEEALEAANLKASPMRSWIGLYALLKVLRDAKVTDFSRENVAKAVKEAKDVPMLGIFGDETWTPDTTHEGLFKRAGLNHWATYKWDPEAEAPNGLEGNFVEVSKINWDQVVCGSIFGKMPGPC